MAKAKKTASTYGTIESQSASHPHQTGEEHTNTVTEATHNDQCDSLSSLLKSHDLLCRCDCAGFGWNTVNFLHSNWYGAVIWIYAGNTVDNTGML